MCVYVRAHVCLCVCWCVSLWRLKECAFWCGHYFVDRKVIESVFAVLAAKEEEEEFDRWSTGVTFRL